MAFRCRAATSDEIEAGHASYLEYLGEGAANVIFASRPTRIQVPDNLHIVYMTNSGAYAAPPSDSVLRFSKNVGHAPSCRIIASFFDAVTSRFFRGDTKKHCAFQGILEVDSGIIDNLNTLLEHLEDKNKRNPTCVGTRIRADDLSCLVLSDLTPKLTQHTTIEIKPKWLLQSPSAPWWSLRCRTCALRAQRAAKGASRRRLLMDHGESVFCPLTLVSEDQRGVKAIFVERLRRAPGFAALSKPRQADMEKLTVDYFTSGDGRALLLKLRHWQAELDPMGFPFIGATINGVDLRMRVPNGLDAEWLKMAMTFRDCSMFVCVHYGAEVPFVQAYLVDLDPKGHDKIVEWWRKEQTLVNRGWYTCKEENAKPEEVCVLTKEAKRHAPWWT